VYHFDYTFNGGGARGGVLIVAIIVVAPSSSVNSYGNIADCSDYNGIRHRDLGIMPIVGLPGGVKIVITDTIVTIGKSCRRICYG